MKIINHIPAWLRNKYMLAFTGFAVWLLFFDRNDLITQHHRTQEYYSLLQSKAHYSKQIKDVRSTLEQLKNDPSTLEKFAREKYFMKRDNEELFIIPAAGENN